MALKPKMPDGPIPGENFTSDTRNYPWHRPPTYTNPDEALESIFKRLRRKEAAQGIVTMLEMGTPISLIVDLFLTKGIERGEWSIDLALLLAGPLSHVIVILARTYDLEYDLGISSGGKVMTSALFEEMNKPKKVTTELTNKAIDLAQKETGFSFGKGFN